MMYWFGTMKEFMVCFLSSLNFRHSSLIALNTTHVWHHHSISIPQYFLYYLWVPYLSLIASLLFLFLSKLTEPSEKKKRKKKKESNSQEEREKKSQNWSKVAARYCLWVPFVCLITILQLSYELWKLKTAKMYFQFP